MRKIGTALGGVLVAMTPDEFTALSGRPASNVPDNTEIGLNRLEKMNAFMNTNKSKLTELYKSAGDVQDILRSLRNGD